ncbi:MAG TPA: hypothetical protein VLH16_01890, partial [Bacteroidales bacterium]|nr:hypothetical protein [Bacteroidales bacterium]
MGKKDGLIYHDSTAVVVASRQVSANVTPSGSGEAEILTPSLFQWPAVSNRVVAAGISDPGIGEDITGRMAIIRAMVVAGLLNNSTVQNVTETYYRQLPGQKLSTASFNSLSKIVSVLRFDTAAILISEQQITGAGEKIVLITADSSLFNPSLYCDRVEINAEVFYSETPLTLGDRIYMYFKIKAVKKTSGGESIPLFNWELHSDNNRIEFRSEFEGKEVYFPIR